MSIDGAEINFEHSLKDSPAKFMHVYYTPKKDKPKEQNSISVKPQNTSPQHSNRSERHNPHHSSKREKADNPNRDSSDKTNAQSADNSGDPSPLLQNVWKKLTQHWELQDPELLISVTGGAKKFTVLPRLGEILKEGLVNVAINTNAWIITGGTATGVMKLVGEAAEGYVTDPESKKKKSLVVLGIACWGFVADRHLLRKAEKSEKHNPAPYSLRKTVEEDKDAPLDHNHTHFILVDDGTIGKPGGEIKFRSNLEKFISSQRETKVPSVLIVVEGGVNTIRTVNESLDKNIPVVVIGKSGRAADFIAHCISSRHKTHCTDLQKEAAGYLSQEESKGASEAAKDMLECLKQDGKKELLTIFNPQNLEKADLEKDLIEAVLSAILAANDEKVRKQVLLLAIKWHRWEFAEKYLFTQENKDFWQPEVYFQSALEENQLDFVKHLLFLGIELDNFLTASVLQRLYESNDQDMKDLLCLTTSSEGELYKSVHINRIMVSLMRDDSFAWHSDVKASWSSARPNRAERNLFVWAILSNRHQLAYLFWKRGRDQLGGALCACALLKELSTIAEKHDTGDSGILLKHSEEWERRAYDVLSVCYSRDLGLTHRLLVRGLAHWDSNSDSTDPCTPECRGCLPEGSGSQNAIKPGCPTLLNMAQAYELMEFAGHQACQTKLTVIWKGYIASDTSLLLILLCTFLPVFIPLIRFRSNKKPREQNKVSTEENSKDAKKNNCCPLGFFCTLHYFYTAPVVKFFCNIASFLVYLVIFSYFVLVQLDEGSPTILEYITWAWLFTMILEEFREMLFRHQLSLKYRLLNWLRNLWNQIDLTMYIFFFVSVALRFAIPAAGGNFKWVRAFYSVTLVLSYIRFLHYFYAVKRVGPKVIMIQKMMIDMFLFIAIMIVFVIGFGVAYHANMYPKAPPDFSILVNIVYFTYFQIYGELFLGYFRGEAEQECTSNETIWRQDPIRRCPDESRYILHLLLGVYLVLTNIMLVNLLIAMFSHTFQKVQENSLKVWRFYRLSLVHEYFDRPALVPPLIIFNHIFRIIRHFSCHSLGYCKRYNAFRRPYEKKKMQRLTLFEKGAVLKYDSRWSKADQADAQNQETQTERPVLTHRSSYYQAH